MSFLLERLVTTLLSLDYLHHGQKEPEMLSCPPSLPKLPSMPSRCRSSSLSSSSSSDSDECSNDSKAICQYHAPPSPTINYENNDTVFGAILRGDLPAVTLAESSRLLAIEDIQPRAPLHALIIPKAFVGSVFDIEAKDDWEWMQELHAMALTLVQTHHPEAYARGDFRLCFHIPPFHSVEHLHLHVLAPFSQMGLYYRHIKYNPQTRWCSSLQAVLERLQLGQTAVPYRRPPSCRPQKERLFPPQSESSLVETSTSNHTTTTSESKS